MRAGNGRDPCVSIRAAYGRNLLPFVELFIELRELVKFFEPLVQCKVRHSLHSD